jgi:hypothetical protein
VAEDERSVEETATDEIIEESSTGTSSTGEGRPSLGADRTPDDAAETFLELDDELDLPPETPESSEPRRGLVVDAERVEAASVPAGYPLSARTDRAVALAVDLGEATITVYLSWPDDSEGETALTWLLDAMGVELGDLYGTTVLVERVDGHDVAVTPDERPRGADLGAGVVGGLGALAGIVGLGAATGGLSLAAYFVFLGITLGWLPYTTYKDAWYVRTHSDWEGGPAFWATLLFVPVVNLAAGVAYLWSRSRATFFDGRGSLLGEIGSRVRDWL